MVFLWFSYGFSIKTSIFLGELQGHFGTAQADHVQVAGRALRFAPSSRAPTSRDVATSQRAGAQILAQQGCTVKWLDSWMAQFRSTLESLKSTKSTVPKFHTTTIAVLDIWKTSGSCQSALFASWIKQPRRCNGCCWRRSTTSFHSSRSCFTRSNCDLSLTMQLKGLPRWKVKRECLKMPGIPSDQLVHLLNLSIFQPLCIQSFASSAPRASPKNGLQLLIYKSGGTLGNLYQWKVFYMKNPKVLKHHT